MPLRIGQITYANCTPIFTKLLETADCSRYRFIRGVPSHLNAMLAKGEIDICPSSSIEYGKWPESYVFLPDLSISCIGAVKSVLLFSTVPIEELDGTTVGLTVESDTSVNLLAIILRKFCGLNVRFERCCAPPAEAFRTYPALLLIGDAALRESLSGSGLLVYDLGELWHRFTGLPFVFALWLVRREIAEGRGDELAELATALVAAKERAYADYGRIADGCDEKGWMDRELLVDYWNTISYDLTPAHIQGVETFFSYAAELGLLPGRPELRIFNRKR